MNNSNKKTLKIFSFSLSVFGVGAIVTAVFNNSIEANAAIGGSRGFKVINRSNAIRNRVNVITRQGLRDTSLAANSSLSTNNQGSTSNAPKGKLTVAQMVQRFSNDPLYTYNGNLTKGKGKVTSAVKTYGMNKFELASSVKDGKVNGSSSSSSSPASTSKSVLRGLDLKNLNLASSVKDGKISIASTSSSSLPSTSTPSSGVKGILKSSDQKNKQKSTGNRVKFDLKVRYSDEGRVSKSNSTNNFSSSIDTDVGTSPNKPVKTSQSSTIFNNETGESTTSSVTTASVNKNVIDDLPDGSPKGSYEYDLGHGIMNNSRKKEDYIRRDGKEGLTVSESMEMETHLNNIDMFKDRQGVRFWRKKHLEQKERVGITPLNKNEKMELDKLENLPDKGISTNDYGRYLYLKSQEQESNMQSRINRGLESNVK